MGMARLIGGGLAGLGLVGAGYAGLAGKDDTTRDESGQVVEGGQLGAFRIRIGDCLGGALEGTFEAVEAEPCSEPHTNEVYAAFLLPGDLDAPFPGEVSVESDASRGCFDRFAPFVGIAYEDSIYEIGSITPTPGSWDQVDDREVLCLICRLDGEPTTGSAQNSAQ
jgi:hypothetical protein